MCPQWFGYDTKHGISLDMLIEAHKVVEASSHLKKLCVTTTPVRKPDR